MPPILTCSCKREFRIYYAWVWRRLQACSFTGEQPHSFNSVVTTREVNMSGWIKFHRQFIEWEWFTDVNTCHLFTYLLLKANHRETKWRGHTIMAGQLLTGRAKLAEATGLSQQNVRTSLDKLKSTNELTSKTFNKYSIITITNWYKYQDINQQLTSELTNNQPATNQQLTTFKNVKNIKNEKNIKKKEGKNLVLPLPEWLPLDDWNDYLEMRAKIKKPPTSRAKQLVIIKLDELKRKGHDPAKILQESTMNNWQNVYPPKKEKNNENTSAGYRGIYTNNNNGASTNDKHQRTLEAAARGHARAQTPDF